MWVWDYNRPVIVNREGKLLNARAAITQLAKLRLDRKKSQLSFKLLFLYQMLR